MNRTDVHGHWTLSKHAALRMAEMMVGIDEVLLACVKPRVTYPGGMGHPGKEHCRTHQHGRITVIVDPERKCVVTILWRTDVEYRRGSGDPTKGGTVRYEGKAPR